MNLLSFIKADLYKLKRSPLILLHVLAPLLAATIFLAYYRVSGWSQVIKISAYLEVIAVSLPLLIGLISSLAVSQELQAGVYRELLGISKHRRTTLLSKLVVLILLASFSVLLAIMLFAFGMTYILKASGPPISYYVGVSTKLIVSSVLIYLLSIFCSMQFGRGASISLGIFGSLIAALMITGLGDKYWMYIPWGWGVRFCDITVLKWIKPDFYPLLKPQLITCYTSLLVFNSIALVLTFYWFKKYEANKIID